jgi:hypothetical protein
MAIAVCGMHYTGMAALRVHQHVRPVAVPGIDPILLFLPIVATAVGTVVALVLGSLPNTAEDAPRHSLQSGPVPLSLTTYTNPTYTRPAHTRSTFANPTRIPRSTRIRSHR